MSTRHDEWNKLLCPLLRGTEDVMDFVRYVKLGFHKHVQRAILVSVGFIQ